MKNASRVRAGAYAVWFDGRLRFIDVVQELKMVKIPDIVPCMLDAG